MSHCRILLADDHMMFRQGIRLLLETIDDLEIVGEVGNGLKLVQMARCGDRKQEKRYFLVNGELFFLDLLSHRHRRPLSAFTNINK